MIFDLKLVKEVYKNLKEALQRYSLLNELKIIIFLNYKIIKNEA